MPDEVIDPAATGEAAVQPGVSTETVSAPTPESVAEELFYDASKVPPELQPTFKDMQAAWTKKTQGVSAWRKLEQDYGSAEEVAEFLSQFSQPQGVLNWWFRVAQELGLSREQLATLMQGQRQQAAPQGRQPQQPNPEEGALTRQEFMEWQRQQEATQRRQAEDSEIESTLQELQVPAEDRDLVILEAYRQPFHLGYAERLKRGFAAVNERQKTRLAAVTSETARKNATAPKALGGTTGDTSAAPIKDFNEAKKRASARLAGLQEQ